MYRQSTDMNNSVFIVVINLNDANLLRGLAVGVCVWGGMKSD